jgi:hypothetical protein
MNVGDVVVAARNIGGFAREFVPSGTVGVVTLRSWGETEVTFTIRKLFRDAHVTIPVYAGEVNVIR